MKKYIFKPKTTAIMRQIKAILTVIVFAITSLAISAQTRIVPTPEYSWSNSNNLYIDSVTVSNSETILHCHLEGSKDFEYYTISSKSILQGETGEKYKLTDAHNIKLDAQLLFRDRMDAFTLHFDPLKGGDETFTYLGVNERGKGNEYIIKDVRAYKIVNNPKHQSGTKDQHIQVEHVELKAKETVLHCKIRNTAFNWVAINSLDKLIGDSGEEYALKYAEGIDVDTRIFMPKSGFVECKLYFEPLSEIETSVDYIEVMNTYPDPTESVVLRELGL